MLEHFHTPVMVAEVLDLLRVAEGGLYMDCTLGGGGHSQAILDRGGNVVAMDRDPDAVAYAKERLAEYNGRFSTHQSVFSRIWEIAGERAGRFDGVLFDLGISSRMIDDPAKGFSYRLDGPLLMDMGGGRENAYEVVNTRSKSELTQIFQEYGEERKASRIAHAIVKRRASHPIETTGELADIIEAVVGSYLPQKSKARVFQALRIYVNNELEEIQKGLEGALEILKAGGRLCVISYHSLEDRLVKRFMKEMSEPCICPHDLPECRCGKKPLLKIVTRKPVKASEKEAAENPRARSALLRAAEKVEQI
jgi:16S rRNA (cytosine1402-N4)-methyltransferase